MSSLIITLLFALLLTPLHPAPPLICHFSCSSPFLLLLFFLFLSILAAKNLHKSISTPSWFPLPLCMPPFILHPTLLSFSVSNTLRSQMSGYVCVRSIWSTSRLFVEEFLQTSSSHWRGNLNCSAERACCSVPGIWALLFVISSSLSFPTWMPSGQTIWAGRCSRHWKESSSQTLWKGQRGRRGSGCLSVWIRMTMRRAGSCCSVAWHIMGQTGEHKVCKCFFCFRICGFFCGLIH